MKRTISYLPVNVLVMEIGGHLSGGFGDRCVGLVSAILLAQHLHKRFYISWLTPNLHGIITIPHALQLPAHLTSQRAHVTLDAIDHKGKQQVIQTLKSAKNNFEQSSILLRCNMNLFTGLGISVETISETFQSLFTEYLVPTIDKNCLIDSCYVAIQLRCGDTYLNVGNRQFVNHLPNMIQKLAGFVKDNFPECQHIYVSTDHPTAKNEFRRLIEAQGQTMLETAASENFHFERQGSGLAGIKLRALVTDMLRLRDAATLIISNYSKYGKLMALMRSNPCDGSVWAFSENMPNPKEITHLNQLLVD